jgi:hypothetical protein
MHRLPVAAFIALASFVFVPNSAAADGLPVPVDGASTASAISPTGDGFRYTTILAGPDTRLLQINPDGGDIAGSRQIEGRYSIPLVALDGTAGGVSADGSVVALINPRRGFPREQTSLVIVDSSGARMHVADRLTLQGDFSFDALSPDGLSLYLIEYTSRDYNDYVVREYDLAEGRLLDKPVLVPDEEPGEMRGLPLTRATSPDGRWEYTLYDGGGDGEPFIHGLDTVASKSVCIDLPQLEGVGSLFRTSLDLSPDGGTLSVVSPRGNVHALVDTQSFEVSEPATAAEDEAADDGGIGGLAIAAIAAGIVALVGATVGVLRRRRGAGIPADPFDGADAAHNGDGIAAPDRERVSR